MKLLQMKPAYFKLSDDFQGTFADALRQLADYLEEDSPPLPKNHIDVVTNPWGSFEEVVQNGGRFTGMVGLEELVDGKWQTIRKP